MNLLSALGFLTIIPIPARACREDPGQVLYFPLVGLFLGLLVFALDQCLAPVLIPGFRAVADVLFLAVISGGLHLDGLADTADGFYSHRSREEMLTIMKDPRVGVMGVLAIVFCVLFKVAGVSALQGAHYGVWLILAPALARTAQVYGLVFADPATEKGRLLKGFYQKGKFDLLGFTVVPLVIPFFMGTGIGLFVCFLFFGLTFSALGYFKSKIGGITGDTLGALSEVVEMAILLTGGWVCTQL